MRKVQRQIWSGWGGGSLAFRGLWGQVRPPREGGRDAGGELEWCGCLAGEDRDPGITPGTQEPLSESRKYTPWSPP